MPSDSLDQVIHHFRKMVFLRDGELESDTGQDAGSFHTMTQPSQSLGWLLIIAGGAFCVFGQFCSAQEPKERATLNGHTGHVDKLAFSADGKVLASGGWDSRIQVWRPKSESIAARGDTGDRTCRSAPVAEFAGHSNIRTTELYFVRKEEDGGMAARRIQIRVRRGRE
jgi:WD40 repeat protein